ncbi:Threonine dehydratase [Croceitalea dokdonensis DOKDO 023]|uniref:L-threonine dehydratase n=1 Tax=Croceitalea dokdonensis DOKDO 023 TaxID=1300341 RepID=A0A0P7AVQ8_9FLAO|nr:threonine ammonia-lyase IlvA [Croceitalea dokdonensis]KPM32047.1 Threonine dehydratase [Croceitalea dokdonensis DOKDO 023]
MSRTEKRKGVICASAGNHSQGVAYSCKSLGITGTIFMPITRPIQKVEQVKMFGESFVEVVLYGDTFDDAKAKTVNESKDQGKVFVHPFDDPRIIEGQATVGLELTEQADFPIDYIFVPVGGGGLVAGILTILKHLSPKTTVIGLEPEGAASMLLAIDNGHVSSLSDIDTFVDGASVKQVGGLNFSICHGHLKELLSVPSGKVAKEVIELYNRDAMVIEPAGVLSVSALDYYRDIIKEKNVACILSGGNNDISRTPEFSERALLFENLKHYFLVNFPQRAGALREFVIKILGPNDDITFFQFIKKNNSSRAIAVVGVELKSVEDLQPLIHRKKLHGFYSDHLNGKPELLKSLVWTSLL